MKDANGYEEPVDGNFHFEVGLHKALAGRTLRAQPEQQRGLKPPRRPENRQCGLWTVGQEVRL